MYNFYGENYFLVSEWHSPVSFFFRKAAGSFNVEGARVPDKSFPGV